MDEERHYRKKGHPQSLLIPGHPPHSCSLFLSTQLCLSISPIDLLFLTRFLLTRLHHTEQSISFGNVVP